MSNDHLILLCGKSSCGKTYSLSSLRNPQGVLYLNCENGKKTPFKNGFIQKTITDPHQIFEAFDWASSQSEVHTIVIDSLTYMLDMYESLYVHGAANGQQAWGNFAQFFKKLMLQYVAASKKKIIFTAHTLDTLNESEMLMETKVPVKGSIKNNGIESYFTVVIAAKKVTMKALKDYSSPLLTFTDEEKLLGYKYVFQTKLTKETVNERLRGAVGMFTTQETFIDNNIQNVLDKLETYYA